MHQLFYYLFSILVFFWHLYSLKKGERVELRGFGAWSTRIQKASIRRNPKTGEKVKVSQKKTIHFKISKDLFNKINSND